MPESNATQRQSAAEPAKTNKTPTGDDQGVTTEFRAVHYGPRDTSVAQGGEQQKMWPRQSFRRALIGWFDIAVRVKTRMAEDRLSLISAGVAFFGMLALFPAITAILAVGGLVLDRGKILDQIDRWRGLIPEAVLTIISNQAMSVTISQGLGWTLGLSVALALWSASRGVNVVFDGLILAYREEESRGFLLRTAEVFTIIPIITLGFVMASLVIAGLPVVLSLVPLGPVADIVARTAAWIILIGLLFMSLGVLYRFGPSRENPGWVWVTPGAELALIGWLIASVVFTVYVSNFANYNESFGALGGVIVLLLWLWISAFVVLIGGEINAETEGLSQRIDQ